MHKFDNLISERKKFYTLQEAEAGSGAGALGDGAKLTPEDEQEDTDAKTPDMSSNNTPVTDTQSNPAAVSDPQAPDVTGSGDEQAASQSFMELSDEDLQSMYDTVYNAIGDKNFQRLVDLNADRLGQPNV